MYYCTVYGEGLIAAAGETVLAVSAPVVFNTPGAQCSISGMTWADLTAASAQAVTFRLYDGPDPGGALMAEWPLQAQYDATGAQGSLAAGCWPVGALHDMGEGPTPHQHCMTAELTSADAGALFECYLTVALSSETAAY